MGGYYLDNAIYDGSSYSPKPLPVGIKFNITTGVFSGEPTDTLPPTNYYITGYNADTSSASTVSIRVGSVPLPTLKYSHPPVYTKGVPITPFVPESTGVAAFGYSTPVLNNGVSAQIVYPTVFDAAGNTFIVDGGNAAIGELPANGSPYRFLVKGVSGGTGIAIDSAKNLYVAFYANGTSTIIKYPMEGAGTPVTLPPVFNTRLSISADSTGNLYVLDGNVEKIPAGAGTSTTIASGFTAPTSIALDRLGYLYVADPTVSVRKINTVPPYNSTNITTGSNPESVTADGAGNVYISNTKGKAYLAMLPAGGSSPPDTVLSSNLYDQVIRADLKGNLFLESGYGIATSYRTGGYFLNTPLPQGLSFNSKTGVISGTPTAATAYKTYSVTAYNGTGGTVDNFVLYVAPGNKSVTTLKASNGNLSPAFSPGITSYTDTVADVSESLTSVLSDQLATATINGVPVSSGTALPIQLQLGLNKVNFTVVPGDGSAAQTYTVNIIRAAINPVLTDDGLIVHRAITPNGDGINDVLTIDKIAAFPNNKLMIISNSGALVYEASSYDNKLKAFDGHSSINGKLQPAGTYFYSLQYTINGKSKTKTGYVVLKY